MGPPQTTLLQFGNRELLLGKEGGISSPCPDLSFLGKGQNCVSPLQLKSRVEGRSYGHKSIRVSNGRNGSDGRKVEVRRPVSQSLTNVASTQYEQLCALIRIV